MVRLKRVVLLMHNWTGYIHGVQWGISNYLLQRPNWMWSRLLPFKHSVELCQADPPDGIISFVEPEFRQELSDLKIPVVDLSNWWPESPFPRVLPDDQAVGRMAAQYMIDLGLRNFGIFGTPGAEFSVGRIKGFADEVERQKMKVDVYQEPATKRVARQAFNQNILHWLQQLPQPAGVFVTNDNNAVEILEICRHGGIAVPERICVLGVDNDELVSRFTHPPLSSIALPTEKIGYEAARLLDSMMSGHAAPTEPVIFPPVNVVARQSTNLLFIPNEDVLAAVRYIREHIHERISVQSLLKAFPVNRRYLERKFRQHVGRTPLQEIRRVRIEKAKELLATTDLSMPAIAKQAGFPNGERLANVFHEVVGQTPTDYRKSHRLDHTVEG